MKKLFFILLILITQINFGQSNIVEINTTGSGETKEEAVQNALLSALKQSFGVFISSNTEIINDVLTKDKISELSSGNILEYNIISETQNGNYFNTLVSSKISINTLASYTKNKVDSNEISGDVFVSNFLIKELNKENELQSIIDLVEYSKKVLPTTLDFFINSGEPIRSNNEKFDFEIVSKIGFKQNENYFNWKEHFNSSLESISLKSDELNDLINQNSKQYVFILNNKILYLRNKLSIITLIHFNRGSNNIFKNITLKLIGLGKSYDFQENIKTIEEINLGQRQLGLIENGIIREIDCKCKDSRDFQSYGLCNQNKIGGYLGRSKNEISQCISFENEAYDNKSVQICGLPFGTIFQPSKYTFDKIIYLSDEKYRRDITNCLFGKFTLPKKYRTKSNFQKIESRMLLKMNLMLSGAGSRYIVRDNSQFFNRDSIVFDETIVLQTNAIQDQFINITNYFKLEDLKKFRGYKLTTIIN